MVNELIKRRNATQATLDAYRGVGFDWSCSSCVHLLHTHLSNAGYVLPEMPDINGPTSALRALRENGWETVSDLLDAFCEPIPPAMMKMGDVALFESAAGLDAIFICAGPHKMFGWREDHNDLVTVDVTLDMLKGAWRVKYG